LTNSKQTTSNHFKPPSNHLKPHQTTSNHFKPLQTTSNHLQPHQTTFKPPQFPFPLSNISTSTSGPISSAFSLFSLLKISPIESYVLEKRKPTPNLLRLPCKEGNRL